MTKADLINEITNKTGIDRADVDATVEAFVVIVKNSVADGQTINIRGFGSFGTKKRARKLARNITKNTALIVEEHYIPIFKPSKFFVEKIKKSDKFKK